MALLTNRETREAEDARCQVEENVPLAQLMLHSLTPAQVQLIDRALMDIGPFGEVRLVKVKGRLRFIQRVESEDALQASQEDE